MPATDPLARERFRTILADAAESIATDDEGFVDPDELADALLPTFPGVHFEHRTNEAGVPMRRVIVASEWEVDPSAVSVPPRPAPCPGTARNGGPCHAEPGHGGGHRAGFPA